MASTVGGCLCGNVRYEITADPMMAGHCYCSDCRRTSGAAMASVMLVPKDAFRLTKGELKFFAVKGDSGNEVSRGFCANCGSGIVSKLAMPMVAVKAGSLDDQSKFRPSMNLYKSSAPTWAPMTASLQTFDKMPR
ncbi:MAG TPA: GFA family protein [Candidatus Binataceae bacterium]|nr:GFA family protein [Candidatus Binataceae bacterium]